MTTRSHKRKLCVDGASADAQTDDDGDECSICSALIHPQSKVHLACGHTFHGSCAVEWLQRNRRCPLCRHQLPGQGDASSQEDEEDEDDDDEEDEKDSTLAEVVATNLEQLSTAHVETILQAIGMELDPLGLADAHEVGYSTTNRVRLTKAIFDGKFDTVPFAKANGYDQGVRERCIVVVHKFFVDMRAPSTMRSILSDLGRISSSDNTRMEKEELASMLCEFVLSDDDDE